MTPELRNAVRIVVDAAVAWRRAQMTPRSWMAPETVTLVDAVDHMLDAVADARERCTAEVCNDEHCPTYDSSTSTLQELCRRERALARRAASALVPPEDLTMPPSQRVAVAQDPGSDLDATGSDQ